MSKRDEVFELFGPKLIEASLRIILDEVNTLRAAHGLSPRTELQFYDQITNHYSTIDDYEWQEE